VSEKKKLTWGIKCQQVKEKGKTRPVKLLVEVPCTHFVDQAFVQEKVKLAGDGRRRANAVDRKAKCLESDSTVDFRRYVKNGPEKTEKRKTRRAAVADMK